MTSDVQDARIDTCNANGVCFAHFLMALYFLKIYPTLVQITGPFDYSEKTCSKWVWFFVKKIVALKDIKVSATAS